MIIKVTKRFKRFLERVGSGNTKTEEKAHSEDTIKEKNHFYNFCANVNTR
jgi:hypothetical protein